MKEFNVTISRSFEGMISATVSQQIHIVLDGGLNPDRVDEVIAIDEIVSEVFGSFWFATEINEVE